MGISLLLQIMTVKIITCTARDIYNDSESLPGQVLVGAMQTGRAELMLHTVAHVHVLRSWRYQLSCRCKSG